MEYTANEKRGDNMKPFKIEVTEKEKDMISACLKNTKQLCGKIKNEFTEILEDCILAVENYKENN